MNNTRHEQWAEQRAQEAERLRRTRPLARALVDSGFKTLAMRSDTTKCTRTKAARLSSGHTLPKRAGSWSATEKLSLPGETRREGLACGHCFEYRKW